MNAETPASSPTQLSCPHCDSEELSTLETLYGAASCSIQSDGEIVYEGDTEIWWDTQKTVRKDARAVIVCRSCSEEFLLDKSAKPQLLPSDQKASGESARSWLVIGVYDGDTGNRHGDTYIAATAKEAEEAARENARSQGAELIVAGVLDEQGKIVL